MKDPKKNRGRSGPGLHFPVRANKISSAQKTDNAFFNEKLNEVKTLADQNYYIFNAGITALNNSIRINFKNSLEDNPKVFFAKVSQDPEYNIKIAADVLVEVGFFKKEMLEIEKFKKDRYGFAGYSQKDKIVLSFTDIEGDKSEFKVEVGVGGPVGRSKKTTDLSVMLIKKLNKILAANIMVKSGYLTQEQAAEIFPIESNGKGVRDL